MNGHIRKHIVSEEFDYQILLDALQGYSRPRDKITRLLKSGEIIRVKKGLYIFGEGLRKHPYCREVLANLIYGPSYISLEYALSYHGLIPEQTPTLTSVTTGRTREFATPVGRFLYRMIPISAYRSGMSRIELEDGRGFLMAIPEKALADTIQAHRGVPANSQKELLEYLMQDLRVDEHALARMNAEYLGQLATDYRSRKIKLLSKLVRRMGQESRGTIDA